MADKPFNVYTPSMGYTAESKPQLLWTGTRTSIKCTLARKADYVAIDVSGTKYKMPVSGDQLGQAPACNYCQNQLLCLSGQASPHNLVFKLS